MRPPEALPHTTATIEATLAVALGHRDVDAVREACGLGSKSSAYWRLCFARAAGLVDWEPFAKGTMRPLVEIVDVDLGTNQ